MGLYRDDGLLSLRGTNGRKADKATKNIIEIFKKIKSQIDIVTNLKEVNFLDVTFNLEGRTFFPYKKPAMNYCISTSHPTILQKSSSNFSTQSIKD